MAKPRIALVSREVAPLAPGGIGAFVAATAAVLAPVADVTIFTTARHRRAYDAMAAAGPQVGDPRGADALPPARFVFVPESRGFELGGFRNHMHAWSGRIYEAIRETYGDAGPDLIEFQDFLGEGCVSVQARRARSPGLRRTTVCVRLNTTSEIVRVLDGAYPAPLEERLTFALERHALTACDHVVWAGGDILAAYQRYYGRETLAAPVRIRQPFAFAAPQPAPDPQSDVRERPLRLLYLGRLERRKGVHNLVEAVTGLRRGDLELTIAGADTHTGPLGVSMQGLLELEAAGDRRITIRDAVPRDDVSELISAHDVLVVPSLWECWPNVALEALERNRPVLATPTGGLTDLVQRGRSGWLAPGPTADDLAMAIEALAERRNDVFVLIESGRPRRVCEELTDADAIREAYLGLCRESGAGAPARQREPPLVSIVIPYHGLPAFVEEAVASAASQTHPATEILLVNDGSFAPEDEAILARIAGRYPVEILTQRNSGLGAARNFGIGQARGEYVFPLDADNVAHPDFVARCVEVLESDPELAYVNSWSRYIDERGGPWRGIDDGERPLAGTGTDLLTEANLAGDAAAVIRTGVFDAGHRFDPELTSYEDWSLYRELAAAGLRGATIPEPLISYRVRGDSMARRVGEPHRERLREELAARDRERAMRWVVGDEREGTRGSERETWAAREREAAATRLERGPASRSAAAAAAQLAGAPPEMSGGRARAVRAVLRRPASRMRNVARRAVLRVLR